jgi:hypothetical protein
MLVPSWNPGGYKNNQMMTVNLLVVDGAGHGDLVFGRELALEVGNFGL